MLWEPAVPSCLLNNYGSILGPDNIDPRHCRVSLHRGARCTHVVSVARANRTLTQTCQSHAKIRVFDTPSFTGAVSARVAFLFYVFGLNRLDDLVINAAFFSLFLSLSLFFCVFFVSNVSL